MTIDRTTPPPSYPIPMLQLPLPNKEVLPNGLTLYWLDSGTIDVNQLVLIWRGGHIEAHNISLANLTASMLKEGASGYSSMEIAEALDFNGAALKSTATNHYTLVSITSINSLVKNILPIVKSIIECPEFNEEALQSYRDIEEHLFLNSESKIATTCSHVLARLIMGKDNPNAQTQSLKEIREVKRQQMLAWHRRVFTASGCTAFLSGHMPASLRQEITAMLASLPADNPAIDLDIVPYHAMAPQIIFTERDDSQQSAVQLALPAPPRSHPDYLPLRFAVNALGGYFGSRLMLNIREDKGYTYGIHANLVGAIEGSYILVHSQADAAYIDPIIREIKNEMMRLASIPMDDTELHRLKQYVGTTLLETVDSPFSIMDYYRTKVMVNLPEDYYDRQSYLAHNITSTDVMDMARKYLHPDQLRISIAGRK